jgi:hypothetical protein
MLVNEDAIKGVAKALPYRKLLCKTFGETDRNGDCGFYCTTSLTVLHF